MALVKVSELKGKALDYTVTICEGVTDSEYMRSHLDAWEYSTDWGQAGPIIEREQMDFKWVGAKNCRAAIEWVDEKHAESFGPTPLIAAMRCYVVSKLGDVVEIPDELLK